MSFDPVALIEKGYEPQLDAVAWLHGMAPELIPQLGSDWLTGAAYLFGARGPDNVIAVPREGIELNAEACLAMVSAGYQTATPEQMRRLVQAMRTPGISSLVEAAGAIPTGGRDKAPLPFADSVALIVHTGDQRTAVFSNLTESPPAIDVSTRRLWQRIAIHLSSGCRLAGRAQSPDAPDVEAVLQPGGSVAHAVGEGRGDSALHLLRSAAVDMDRARSRAGRADSAMALSLWRGLLAGRWSLVDHFDSDGRRFVLARRNDPKVNEPSALSLRQRQILFYASVGWSNQEIGYALGLAENTVSGHVTRSLKKLGIESRAELVRLSTDVAMAAMAAGGGE